MQFIGVFQFTSIVSEIGVNPRRSGSFVPLVSSFDLAPIDSDFLKEGNIIFRGRYPSDQFLAFEGVAIFRDVIDVVLLDTIMIRFLFVSGCLRTVEGRRRSIVGLGDCIGRGRRLRSRWSAVWVYEYYGLSSHYMLWGSAWPMCFGLMVDYIFWGFFWFFLSLF
jgi:hypothetical protein